MKKFLKWAAVAAVVIVAVLAIVYRAVNRVPSENLTPSERVLAIFEEGGCVSCHSENPKLPFDARNKTIKEPKRPHTKMIQTFSETSLSSIDAQLAKKLLGPHKNKAAIIEPIISDSVHLFVSTDVTMIAKTIISAINPVFIFYE